MVNKENTISLYLIGDNVRRELLGLEKINKLEYIVNTDSYMKMKGYLLKENYNIHLEKEQNQLIIATKNRLIFHFHQNETQNLSQYLSKKTFTINAIAKDNNGKYIDPFNGLRDTKLKVLRTINDPKEDLVNDITKVMVLLNLVVTESFQIEKNLYQSLFSNEVCNKLNEIPSIYRKKMLNNMFLYDSVLTMKLLSQFPSEFLMPLINNLKINMTSNKNIINKQMMEPNNEEFSDFSISSLSESNSDTGSDSGDSSDEQEDSDSENILDRVKSPEISIISESIQNSESNEDSDSGEDSESSINIPKSQPSKKQPPKKQPPKKQPPKKQPPKKRGRPRKSKN